MRSKPVYPGHIKLQSCEVSFSDEQKVILTKICDKSGFIEKIQSIIEHYLDNCNLFSNENKTWTTERENLATLNDLISSLQEMERKLRNMPDKVNVLLYEVDDEISIARKSLEKIMIEGIIIKQKIKKPKTGRPAQAPKKIAASNLKQVFNEYSIPWKHYFYSERHGIPAAITVLSLIFYFEKANLDYEGVLRTQCSFNPNESLEMIAEYIKKA